MNPCHVLLFATIVAQPASPSEVRSPQSAARSRAVVVASKPFGESFLLAEIFAQLLEARGMSVSRRPGLGATEVAFGALRAGAIDVYPEYTGTRSLSGARPRPSSSSARSAISRASRRA